MAAKRSFISSSDLGYFHFSPAIVPERTVLYRVLFHYCNRFLAKYGSRFEEEYGYFRPMIKEVAERVGKYMIRPLFMRSDLSALRIVDGVNCLKVACPAGRPNST